MNKVEYKNHIFTTAWKNISRSRKIMPDSILITCNKNKKVTFSKPIENIILNDNKLKKNTHWVCCKSNNTHVIDNTCCSRQHFYGTCKCNNNNL